METFFVWRAAGALLFSGIFVIVQMSRKGGIPPSRAASAMLALFATGALGAILISQATLFGGVYGLGIFVALPFIAGMIAAMVYGWGRQPLPSAGEGAMMGLTATGILAGVMLVFLYEGLVCLVMAAPLAIPLAVTGGALGSLLLRALRSPRSTASTMLLLALFPSTAIEMERAFPSETPTFEVTTSMFIPAPPEAVWKATIAPSKLNRPKGIAFRAGIAYPKGAWIEGSGPTAIRYCNFSTGRLIEPVLEWRQPEVLRFSVVQNPEPMVEWNPLAEIHPAHLEGFLVSRQGQFRLIPVAGGTRLEASTWYQHGLYPAEYWRWWSDAIIHQIHGVVLAHIRDTV